MKRLLPFCLALFLGQGLTAQVQIVSGNLPDANDTLVQQNVAFDGSVDLELTGANYTWDFNGSVLTYLGNELNTICYDVDNTPIAYQFLFNNPFDPNHNSNFGQGVESISVGTFTFEDAYMYYKNSSSIYSMTGMGVTFSGVPLAAQANETDAIYDLPLDYNDTGSSTTEMEFVIPTIGFWGLDQQREYTVDGWGTLLINDMSIDVLRYRTVVNASDSIYSDLFSFGTTIERPEVIEYRWLSPLYKVPVLQITTTNGIATQSLTAEVFPTIAVEELASSWNIYPNPSTDHVRVQSNGGAGQLEIYNTQGQLIRSERMQSMLEIQTNDLSEGVYYFVWNNGAQRLTKSIVIQ